MFVPVVDKDQNPLMPTTPARAKKWIRSGKATPFWRNGVFCVRLNQEPSHPYKQEICVGVDPGSKKEGFTVKSEDRTYLNVQADAHSKVGKKVEKRRELRRGRRSRKCPNRKNRQNRLAHTQCLPAGTRARWDWKLRLLDWLSKMFPITRICVEDIKARTRKGSRKWNESFSPLEVGKQWFYAEIQKRWDLHTLRGHETKQIRENLGLKKSSNKLSSDFDAHCVDSWCLASYVVGDNGVFRSDPASKSSDLSKGDESAPDNTDVLTIAPIPIRRRELHRQNPQKGGKRPRYGGTTCLGVAKNTLVKHVKHGVLRISGHQKGLLTLSEINTSKQVVLTANPETYRILTKLNFRYGG